MLNLSSRVDNRLNSFVESIQNLQVNVAEASNFTTKALEVGQGTAFELEIRCKDLARKLNEVSLRSRSAQISGDCCMAKIQNCFESLNVLTITLNDSVTISLIT